MTKEKEIQPGTQKIIFPKSGTYSYQIPSEIPSFSVDLTIEANYLQQSTFYSSIDYPHPETKQYSFSDRFINIDVKKSVHARENQYEVFLDIDVRKSGDVEIEAERKNNSIKLQLSAHPLSFSCETVKQRFSQSVLIDLEKENFIRCSALTPSTEQTSIPFAIKIDYVAKEKKKITFNVKKRWSNATNTALK